MDELVWAIVFAGLGALITSMYVPTLPPVMLWAGWVGVTVGVFLFIRWWLGVVR